MERALRRRDTVLNITPRICSQRAVILTRAYRESEHLPMILRRADAFRRVLTEMTLFIDDDELIVGNQACSPRAAPIFPEYSVGWILDEMGRFGERPHDRFLVDGETRRRLRATLPYWSGKTGHDRIRALAEACLNGPVRECFDFETSNLNQVISNPGQIYSGAGHVTPDFQKMLRVGLDGIMEETRKRLIETSPTCPDGLRKNLFYRAVLTALDGVRTYAVRFSRKSARLARSASDPNRRDELLTVSAACKRVPMKPASTFWEALQAVWFLHVILQIESNGHSMALGRMDQYLYPYFEKDLESGVLNRRRALELVQLFMIKCFELNKLRSWENTQYVAGYPTFQQITLGGQTSTGADAANDLTDLFLEALASLKLSQPSVSVRICKDSSDRFVQAAAQTVVSHGGGLPSFFNDEVVLPMLHKIGVAEADAWNWSVMGCAEPQVMGKFLPGVSACHVNLLKILELTINGGRNPATGKRLHPSKGSLPVYGSLEELMAGYKQQLAYYVGFAEILDSFVARIQEDQLQTPLLSALIAHRIELGRDVTEAAGPTMANQVILGHGAVNVGNALAAIGRLVFEEKRLDAESLMDVLGRNFDGVNGEAVRQMLLNRAPKYGNDDDFVDLLTRDRLDDFLYECLRMRHYWGGKYGPTPQGVSANVPMGASVGATPDGRRAGEPLADNVSPSAGTDLKGPTAVLKSVAKLHHGLAANGTILNLKFHPSALQNQEGIRKFAALIRTFFRMKGMQVQFTLTRVEDLLAAREDPEKYRNLVVKVAGYSALFNALDRRLQDQIIARTTHELPS